MRFTKMHGCGNDYIYVDCFREPMPRDPAGLSRAVSHRHFGIGADGLILICPSDKADARMRMFNADGSEAEMCGNGIRCLAKYVYDHGLVRKPTLAVETGRGVLTLDPEIADGVVRQVRVDMGEPILDKHLIHTNLPGDASRGNAVIDVELPIGIELKSPNGGRWFLEGGPERESAKLVRERQKATCVSMGNPHCVLFLSQITNSDVEHLGPLLEKHPVFLRRTNVEFVRVNRPDDVTIRVWERGSGETLACGTGACAVAVAGVLTGRTARRITAHLTGGDLELDWSERDNHVYLTGPAVEVFSGEWTQ